MLDIALKDIKEHKARSFLTILGIVIAIGAIVSLGSISEGINSLVEGQLEMLGGNIMLNEKDVAQQGPPSGNMNVEDLDEIRQMGGVEAVAGMFMRQSAGGAFFLVGVPFDEMELMDIEEFKFEEGNWPEAGEYKVVVGNTLAESSGLSMGDTIEIEDEDLRVSGILEKTSNYMDFGLITSLETAQNVFDDREHVTMAQVKPRDIGDVDRIAEEIEDEFPNIEASTSEEMLENAKETINQIRLITLGIGFITSLVAAIGIINTMFMTVSERKRQIGIMKATGAERGLILIQILQEGLILALIGGIIGILFGFIGTAALNSSMGMPIAKVTLELALGSIAFSVILTLLSSLYPAYKASKIDPIEAIRSI